MTIKKFDPKRLHDLPMGRSMSCNDGEEVYTRVPGGWVRDLYTTIEFATGALSTFPTSVFIPDLQVTVGPQQEESPLCFTKPLTPTHA